MIRKKVHIVQREEAIVRSYFHLNPLLPDYSYHDDCCFSPNGETFAVISDSNMISLFKCDGCIFSSKIANKKYGCSRIRYHPVKNALYQNSSKFKNSSNSASDHAARLLDTETSGFIRYFATNGHTDQITTLTPIKNGLITSSLDQKIKFWDDSQEGSTVTIDLSHPANIAMHPNGLCMAAATLSTLYLYDTRNLDNFVSSVRINAPGDVVPHFGMLGTRLAVVGAGFAQEYNLCDLTLRSELELTMEEQIPGFAFTPDEQFLLCPTHDYSILVADAIGSQVTVLTGHHSPITSIKFSSAYHNFVSTGRECLFWTVDMQTFKDLAGSI
ncbi:hypothetical protein TRFO_04501 [Tritrichomonas foetus]|uniref:Uncharacterized protein n=1 Tax=Tritrichomonas foetus TaxID=1144522 RepID=A0A1J4KDD0_9EUKA|nr:hypothetical protein TRFO_04501 [Tritrichomonas foetus]|eukprot:OHT09447.1 hypothetical protein TRFO_04501 [Tritrichomonas foetus]